MYESHLCMFSFKQHMHLFQWFLCILQSFTDPSAFILTQYPLKDTEVDLWRLCMDHDVHALVVLEEDNQVLCSFK